MLAAILTGVSIVIFSIWLGATGLPTAIRIVRFWTWIYTVVAPKDDRDSRRAEILSDLHEHREDLQGQGHRPVEVAVLIFLRMLAGAIDDVAWAWPHLCQILMGKLNSSKSSTQRIMTRKLLVTSIACLGFINCLFFAADIDHTPLEWAAHNLGAVLASVLICHQEHPTARRVLYGLMGVAIASGTFLLAWLVIDYRLYDEPLFRQMMLSALPIFVMVIVGSKGFRVRAFGGRWWPALVAWVVIGGISIATADHFAGSLTTLLTVWGYMALVVLSYGLMAAFLGLWLLVVWLAAGKGIRRPF